LKCKLHVFKNETVKESRLSLRYCGSGWRASYSLWHHSWEKGYASAAVGKYFKDWLEHWGNVQILKEKKIIAKIQFFFEMHGNSRFTDWHDDEVKTVVLPK
jgi:hypothetical protein